MSRIVGILTAAAAVIVLAATAGLASGGEKGKAAGQAKAAEAKAKTSNTGSSNAPAAQASAKGQAMNEANASSNGAGKSGGKAKAGKAGGKARVQSEHEPPGCNGTIHISESPTAGNGTQPKYTTGQTVYVHGRGFDEAEVFLWWDVKKVNSGHALIDSGGGWTADGAGSFMLETVNTAQTPGHEYQVRVYWEETLPNGDTKTCHKSKNFFTFGEEEQGGGGNGGGGGGNGGGQGGGNGGGQGGGGAGGVSAGGGQSGGGGVLGAVAQGELPFTGLPLWIPLLAGGALIAGGLMLRRRAQGSEL